MNKICTQEQFDLIDRWYQEHPSVKSIAEKYREHFGRISQMTIAKYLKHNGYETYERGKKPPLSDDAKKKMMQAKFHEDDLIDLSGYDDYAKISFLSRRFSHYKWKWDLTFARTEFFDYFYHDEQFNHVFDVWVANEHHKLLTPSFDHIVPLTQGGDSSLTNLQCLPVWENRAKYNFSQDEWQAFKDRFVS